MKKLIRPIIHGLIASVAVTGFTVRANAQLIPNVVGGIRKEVSDYTLISGPGNGAQCKTVADWTSGKLYAAEDPTKFWDCAPYGWQLLPCAPGTEFDQEANRCEWPDPSSP